MRHVVSCLSGILLLAGPAMGQVYEQSRPASTVEKGVLVEWLIAVGFLVACLVVSFMPAKRSNLK